LSTHDEGVKGGDAHTTPPVMKVTRSSTIARAIQAEVGGSFLHILAKVAGIVLMNPTWTDEEVAGAYATMPE